MNLETKRKRLKKMLDSLPDEKLSNVERLLIQLRAKKKSKRRLMTLEGIWADKSFNVGPQDVRKLRRRISKETLEKKV